MPFDFPPDDDDAGRARIAGLAVIFALLSAGAGMALVFCWGLR
jgi:hypothetical protein